MDDLEAMATGRQFARLSAEMEVLKQKVAAYEKFIDKHRDVLEEAEKNAAEKPQVPVSKA